MTTAFYWRWTIGRALIHLGLRIAPPGRARSDLYQLFELWGTRVRRAVKEVRHDD